MTPARSWIRGRADTGGQFSPALRHGLALASILALVMLAVLPLGVPAAYRFVLPLLPVIAIFYWTARRLEPLAPWFMFVCGLVIDVLTSGPLGFWPLIYLVGLLAALRAADGPLLKPSVRWLRFAGLAAGLSLLQWATASIYGWSLVPYAPFGAAAAIAAAVEPALVWVLGLLAPERGRATWTDSRG